MIYTTEVILGNKRIYVLKTASSINVQITPLHKKEKRKNFSGRQIDLAI